MNHRKTNLMTVGLALIALAAVDAAPPAELLPFLGAEALSAQDSTTVLPPQNSRQEARLFLEARRAMNAEDFERAATLFAAVRDSRAGIYARYVPDAYYWEAFTRYRQGDLEDARVLLEMVMVGHEEAQMHGRLYADVRNLRLEIQSRLASGGDPGQAEELLRTAEATLEAEPDFRVMLAAPVITPAEITVETSEGGAYSLLADSLAVALQPVADAAGRPSAASPEALLADYARQAEEVAEVLADYERQVEEAAANVAAYERQAANYDWQRAEYQERLRAAGQEQQACEDVSVRLAALQAVMRYEVNRVQVLREVLARDDECSLRLQEEAAGLVGREGTDEALRVLLNLTQSPPIGHPRESVRRHALQELWRFDSPNAFAVLRRTLANSDDRRLQRDAIDGLRRMQYTKNSIGLDNGPTQIEDALINAALKASNEQRVRSAAIYALSRREEVEAGVFIPIYEELDSDDLKEDLLGAVGRKVPEKEDMETAAWARSIAFDVTESADVRNAAFDAWAAHPTVTVAYLADMYKELSEPFLKRQAIFAIYQRAGADPSAPTVLMELIRNEPDPEVRERGIYWLGNTESEAAVEFLLEILGTAPPDTVSHRPG